MAFGVAPAEIAFAIYREQGAIGSLRLGAELYGEFGNPKTTALVAGGRLEENYMDVEPQLSIVPLHNQNLTPQRKSVSSIQTISAKRSKTYVQAPESSGFAYFHIQHRRRRWHTRGRRGRGRRARRIVVAL